MYFYVSYTYTQYNTCGEGSSVYYNCAVDVFLARWCKCNYYIYYEVLDGNILLERLRNALTLSIEYLYRVSIERVYARLRRRRLWVDIVFLISHSASVSIVWSCVWDVKIKKDVSTSKQEWWLENTVPSLETVVEGCCAAAGIVCTGWYTTSYNTSRIFVFNLVIGG